MKTSIVSKLPLMLALASSLTILGCSTTHTTETGRADVCLIWLGISYSAKNDTPETVQGVRENNAKRDSYCN